MLVNGDCGFVSVCNGPDDVLRAPRGVATEEHALACRLEGGFVDGGHVPLVELDADVALDPRECVVLPDGEDDVVAGDDHGVDYATHLLAVLLRPLEPLELHTHQTPVLDDEALRRLVLDDL